MLRMYLKCSHPTLNHDIARSTNDNIYITGTMA